MSEVLDTLKGAVGNARRSFKEDVDVTLVAKELIEFQDLNPLKRVKIKVLPLQQKDS